MSELSIRNLDDLAPQSEQGRQWSQLIHGNINTGFMQSLEWARFKSRQGLKVIHLGIFQNDRLVAGYLAYYATEYGAQFMVAPHGPVLPWQEEQLAFECLKLLLSESEKLAQEHDLIGLRIEPLVPLPVPELLLEFGRAPLDLIPRETLCLDLRPELDQILNAMKPKGRYNTKLSQRKEVSIRKGLPGEMLDSFYPLLSTTARRNHFDIEPPSFFLELADTLIDNNIGHLLLAEHQGEVLGGLVLITCGQTATYLYGGISNNKRSHMIGYALQWQAIIEARSRGCTRYDFYGFDQFRSPQNPYGRFSNFKSQFGGSVERYIGAHDYYFMDQLTDALINVFRQTKE